MNGNGNGSGNGAGFRPDELVKIQGRDFVVIGGRLRMLHAANPKCSITTTVFDYELGRHALVFAKVETQAGEYSASAVATAERDPKLVDSLVELAETRAVARALRFAGVGVECCGFEELGAGPVIDGALPRQEAGAPRAIVTTCNDVPDQRTADAQRPRPLRRSSTPATAAQRRCIETLARRIQQNPATAAVRLVGVGLDDLSVTDASRLIDGLRHGERTNASHGSNGEGQP